MVARLVAVGILSHETRDVGHVELHLLRGERKEPVELIDERSAAAEELLEAVYVVRREETVVPRRGLGVVASGGELLEGGGPPAVGATSAEEAGRTVEDVHVVERPAVVLAGRITAAEASAMRAMAQSS